LGIAVDLGTTKLAGYLVDLASGETLASAGAMNPQIAFGEDVMARIVHTINKPEGAEQLRVTIVAALNDLARELCVQASRSISDILDAVIVGNTAMHHLFLGLPVKQLGLAPYVPAESSALDIPAQEIGLELASGACSHTTEYRGFCGCGSCRHAVRLWHAQTQGDCVGHGHRHQHRNQPDRKWKTLRLFDGIGTSF
jgi:uncharacterized 2Fe-2S/4Fe-4S cluster protein (DUF4445 family)